MSKIDDGGQAFPRAGYDGPDNHSEGVLGMSLRDYFAAQAINSQVHASMLAISAAGHMGVRVSEIEVSPETMATNAYRIADAMIARRKAVPE